MRRTFALIQVAIALLADPRARHWGYELSRQSGVRSGVLYSILARMRDEGWLDDGWEEQPRQGRGSRPPRRYYELTDEGRRALGALIDDATRCPVQSVPERPDGSETRALSDIHPVPWEAFALGLVLFGFAPGVALRLIVLAFPRSDPRRHELLAELHHVPRHDRPFWVVEQLEVALVEGLGPGRPHRSAVAPWLRSAAQS